MASTKKRRASRKKRRQATKSPEQTRKSPEQTRTIYRPADRVRLCAGEQCQAAVPVPAEGARVSCPVCGKEMDVPALVATGPEGPGAGAGSEEERLEELWAQEADYDARSRYCVSEAPDGLEEYGGRMETTYEVVHTFRSALHRAWQRWETEGTPDAEQAVFYLTSRLKTLNNQRGKPLTSWGMLYTAAERLEDAGYRQILRCELATFAARQRDADGAEAWLARCDPAPWILELDTAWRTSRAFAHVARQQWQQVIASLGTKEGDVPYDPAFYAIVNGLRVQALDSLGRRKEADDAMTWLVEESPARIDFLKNLFRNRPLYSRCPGVWERLVNSGRLSNLVDEDQLPGEKVEWTTVFFRWVLPGLFLLAGGLVALYGDHVRREAAASVGWPHVRGKIVSSGVTVRKSTSTGGGYGGRHGSSRGSSTSYHAVFEYVYAVKGQRYRGDRLNVAADDKYHTRQAAQAAANTYPVSREVDVYYPPDAPGRAVLEPGTQGSKSVLIAGLILAALAVLYLLISAFYPFVLRRL